MRNYLINIHRFYHHFYRDSFDGPIMPCIIAGLTLNCILFTIDLLFNEGNCIKILQDVHKFAITVPGYIFVLAFYLFYKDRLPSKMELNRKDGMWFGIILSAISIMGNLLASIIKL